MNTFQEYQDKAARTINRELDYAQLLRHALFGLASETGEVLGMYQKLYQGHPIDLNNLRKEIGDVLWMLAELCTALHFDLGEIAEENIQKLIKRYPVGFDPERSVHRPEYEGRDGK